MKKLFSWLGDSCIPRKGPALKHGATCNVADYPAEVVAEWVKTGAARMIDDAEEAPKVESGAGKKSRPEAGGK